MKAWGRPLAIGLGLFVLALALRVWLFQAMPLQGAEPADGFIRAAGVLHVHTTLSDGGGTAEQVVAAAQAAGLDFLVITDHNNLDAAPIEGVHGRTVVLVGTEASTVAGHVVGVGLRDPAYRFSRDPRDTLDDIRDLGGLAFIAHPTSPRADLRWEDWGAPGPWGIEVLNGDSQFRDASWRGRLRAVLSYPLKPKYALVTHMTRPSATLQRWDALLATRDVPGVAGADAHGQIELPARGVLKAPSYKATFGVTQTHVLLEHPLTGQLGPDRAALLAALGSGHAYVGVDGLAPANGFSFVAESAARRWTMGDTVTVPAPRLRAGGRMPAGTRIVLLKDGAPLAETRDGHLDMPAPGPGVYRVEAYVPRWTVPWIITNPIVVTDEATAAARARAVAWPSPPDPVPSPAAVLADFDTDAHFFDPGSDDRSQVAPPVWEAGGGVTGGAARFAFTLGTPDATHPHVFCALVNRQDRDLSGRNGLVLAVRADGVYRFWVQVRDANPASPDEGTEWWFASVRTSPEWRRVAVPFARLRSIQKNSDGRLDPDKVRSLVFVIDAGALKPGSRGVIWIDDLGVY